MTFKELRLGLHADSVVMMVDFLHALGSIDGGFISSPNAFKQTLGLFCHNYTLSLTHPRMYLHLDHILMCNAWLKESSTNFKCIGYKCFSNIDHQKASFSFNLYLTTALLLGIHKFIRQIKACCG